MCFSDEVFKGFKFLGRCLYFNAHRGKMRKAGVDPSHPLVIEEEDCHVPLKGWAEMIRKVYEIDALLCPHCGAEMKVIAFVEDHKVRK